MRKLSFIITFLFFVSIFSTLNAATVRVVEIKKITTGGKYSAPQWSPDGTKIYASGDRGSLVAMNSDGSNVTAVIEGDGFARKFTISPNGAKILYEYNETKGRTSNLWLMNSDGTGKVKIADEAGEPTWSSDGAKMVFWQWPGVSLANADGSGIKKLTTYGSMPIFIDSSSLAFRSGKDKEPGIEFIDLNGQSKGFIQIRSYSKVNVSPDKKKIYIKSNGIRVVDISSGSVSILISSESVGSGTYYPFNFSVSPDGKLLAYDYVLEEIDSGAHLSSDIWVINADGTGKTQITNTPDIVEVEPAWSSDGKKLLFADKTGDLYIATLAFQ